MDKQSGKTAKLDKNPYDRREEKVTKKAFKSVAKSVTPVAKSAAKKRAKMKKPT